MSQLGDFQQLLSLAQQIMDVLNNTTTAIEKVEQKTPVVRENLENFRQLERLALRYLVLARRMGLPEEVGSAVDKVNQLIVTIRMLQISVSMLMASNPVMMLIGVAGLLGAATTLGSGSILEGY